MIAETAAMVAMLVSGMAVASFSGMRGWGLVPFGFIAGISVYVVITFVQLATPLSGSPVLTIALTLALPLGLWAHAQNRARSLGVSPVLAIGAVVSLAGFVATIRASHLYVWHIDSLVQIKASAMLAADRYLDAADHLILEKRLLGTPAVHTAGQLNGEYFLPSLTPMLAVSLLAAIGWLLVQKYGASRGLIASWAVAGLAILSLGTMNRFVFHAFYVNGHLIVAAMLLVIVAAVWFATTEPASVSTSLFVIGMMAVPVIVTTRAEGVLLAGLALIPLYASARAEAWMRKAAALVLGFSMALWNTLVFIVETSHDESATRAGGLVIAGAAIAVTALVLDRRGRLMVLYRAPGVTEALLWAALVAFTIHNPQILRDSVNATYINAVDPSGGWGSAFLLVTVLALVATSASRAAGTLALRFAVTTFFPLMLLTAYARGSAFRVAHADSLNRMLIEVVPVAVLFVGAIALSRLSEASPTRVVAPTLASAPRRSRPRVS